MNKFITFSILLLLIVLGIYFFNPNILNSVNQSDSIQNQSDNNSQSSSDEVKTILSNLQVSLSKYNQNFKTPAQVTQNSSLLWVTEDNYNILINSTPGIDLEINLINKNANQDMGDSKPEYFKDYNSLFEAEMLARGFKLNTKNSTDTSNSGITNKYIKAYEKSEIKCLSSGSSITYLDNGSTIISYSISCTTDSKLKEMYAIQKPFFDVLQKEQSIDRKVIFINQINIEEDKASLSLGQMAGGGFVAFMYKSGAEWKLINAGQSQPLCSELEKRGVPKKYWDCY